ncbi:MAG: SIMPL domain-containing protein [Fimbriimonadales bacterium]
MMKQLASILLLVLPLMVYAQEARDPQNVITVTGSAQVFASPDEAMVRLGVLQQASNAQEAQAHANDIIQKFLSMVTALKVKKENVQTSRMSLNPVFSQRPNEPARITGYQAQDVLTIRLTDFNLIGKVIDAGTSAGVNTVEGIDFQLRNAKGPRARAYKDAVADARSKADAIVEALGLKITGIYDVRADSTGYTPPPRALGMMRSMDMAAATPVEPGQMEVSVSVTVRYRIG